MFSSQDKNMLIGATVTSLADAGLEGYQVMQTNKGQPVNWILVYSPYPAFVPKLSVWIACAGVPTLIYIVGKQTKNPKIIDAAKGGAVYGISELLGQVLSKAAVPTLAYRMVS